MLYNLCTNRRGTRGYIYIYSGERSDLRVSLHTLRPGKRTARPWWGTPAHPDRRPRCRIGARTGCAPASSCAPSWPNNGIDPCHSDCPNRRRFRWHPHRRRRWAWIARVALQWRCSCSCLESGLCSCKNVDSVRFLFGFWFWFGFGFGLIALGLFLSVFLCIYYYFLKVLINIDMVWNLYTLAEVNNKYIFLISVNSLVDLACPSISFLSACLSVCVSVSLSVSINT